MNPACPSASPLFPPSVLAPSPTYRVDVERSRGGGVRRHFDTELCEGSRSVARSLDGDRIPLAGGERRDAPPGAGPGPAARCSLKQVRLNRRNGGARRYPQVEGDELAGG